MLNLLIKTDSHYKVNRKRLKETIEAVLHQKLIKGDLEISINIVGDRMMKGLNRKYRNLGETTDVLSFPLNDQKDSVPFITPPDDILRLGDIVISYPEAVMGAVEENKLVDDKIDELAVHGLMHLLGQHHE